MLVRGQVDFYVNSYCGRYYESSSWISHGLEILAFGIMGISVLKKWVAFLERLAGHS